MSIRHLWAVVRKEIQHILRDRGTFILVLITPTLVLLLMTFSLAVDIEHVPIALLDYDQSPISREFIQRITAGEDLDLYAYTDSIEEIEQLLKNLSLHKMAELFPSNISKAKKKNMSYFLEGGDINIKRFKIKLFL